MPGLIVYVQIANDAGWRRSKALRRISMRLHLQEHREQHAERLEGTEKLYSKGRVAKDEEG